MDFGLFDTWNALFAGGTVPWDPAYVGGELLESETYDKNFEQVGGLLKVIPFHDIEYLPATCSHTFAACSGLIRQQYDDRPTEMPTIEKQTEAGFHALVS